MKKRQQGFGILGIIVAIVVLTGIVLAGWTVYNNQKDNDDSAGTNDSSSTSQSAEITNFDQCVAAGNPVMESYPEQCAANGKVFAKQYPQANPPSANAQTFTGKLTCLPKKGSGEQTLECAIGLQTDDQKYYALKNNPQLDLPMNTRVTVKGVFAPAAADEKYDIAGSIDVSEIEKAE